MCECMYDDWPPVCPVLVACDYVLAHVCACASVSVPVHACVTVCACEGEGGAVLMALRRSCSPIVLIRFSQTPVSGAAGLS